MSDANTSNSGFYSASVGNGSDRVNALVYCRDDVKPDICRSCIKDSINKSREACPSTKEADVWYTECVLRYSNASISNNLDTLPLVYLPNPGNASDMDQFNKVLRDLLDELKGQASQETFASGNESGPGFSTIYGLMQCSPDLSSVPCSNCLDGLMTSIYSCCGGKVGARIYNPSCQLRYETYLFYNETIVEAPPPQLPPTPLPVPPSAAGKDDNRTRTIIIVIVVVIVSLVTLLLILMCIFKRKQKKRTATARLLNDDVEDISSSESLQYEFVTIEVATSYFSDSNKLGQGGFGAVYKGTLQNGQEIAVKRLSRGSNQGQQEFVNEVILVAKLQHRNLVRLLGFCFEGTEKLLIYEFVPNASLDHFIFDSVKRSYLDWERRYKIIGGTARGILYLHEDSRLRIIHRDLKASNVLLDAEMNPKIADFGMARLFNLDETQGVTSRIAWKNWREGTPSNVIDPILRNKPAFFMRSGIGEEVWSGTDNTNSRVSDKSVNRVNSVKYSINEASLTDPYPR
uniref:Uncharacterized protein n=1 Tax=Daucus carota subsp. sativus TaxID=79200 RepID=A0A166IV55_DAUCS